MPDAAAPSRRSLLRLAAALPLAAALGRAQGQVPAAPEEPRFVAPPGPLPEALRGRLDEARAALAGGKLSTNDLLEEPRSNDLRAYTEFRELIRAHARQARLALAPRGEPGPPLSVRLRAVDGEGKALPGALVYAYQTSAKGWYAAEAPHVSGVEGDLKHARLFAYGRTDGEGWVTMETVRPGGYPRSTLPQHIHVHLEGEGDLRGGGEVLFDDDPRLTSGERARAGREGGVIARVTRAGERQRCEAVFALRR